jgi:hypothetical protein
MTNFNTCLKGKHLELTGFVNYEVWKCLLARNLSDLDCQDHCSSTDTRTTSNMQDIDIKN